MAYSNQAAGSSRVATIAGVAVIHGLLGFAFVTGMATSFVHDVTRTLTTTNVPLDEPPPPDAPPPPQQSATAPASATTITAGADTGRERHGLRRSGSSAGAAATARAGRGRAAACPACSQQGERRARDRQPRRLDRHRRLPCRRAARGG